MPMSKRAGGRRLTRAGVLLFHPKPEKLFPGAFIKIGFFRSDTDLVFQDEVHGSLVQQVDKTFDLLTTKYMNYLIVTGTRGKGTYYSIKGLTIGSL